MRPSTGAESDTQTMRRSDTPIVALKRSVRQLLAMAAVNLMLTVLVAARVFELI